MKLLESVMKALFTWWQFLPAEKKESYAKEVGGDASLSLHDWAKEAYEKLGDIFIKCKDNKNETYIIYKNTVTTLNEWDGKSVDRTIRVYNGRVSYSKRVVEGEIANDPQGVLKGGENLTLEKETKARWYYDEDSTDYTLITLPSGTHASFIGAEKTGQNVLYTLMVTSGDYSGFLVKVYANAIDIEDSMTAKDFADATAHESIKRIVDRLVEDELSDKPVECPGCGKMYGGKGTKIEDLGPGVCKECGDDGWWMDPAGGLHSPNEEDPAAQYESVEDDAPTYCPEHKVLLKSAPQQGGYSTVRYCPVKGCTFTWESEMKVEAVESKLSHFDDNGKWYSVFAGWTFWHPSDCESAEDADNAFTDGGDNDKPKNISEFVGLCFHLMQQLGGHLLDPKGQEVEALNMAQTSGDPVPLPDEVRADGKTVALSTLVECSEGMSYCPTCKMKVEPEGGVNAQGCYNKCPHCGTLLKEEDGGEFKNGDKVITADGSGTVVSFSPPNDVKVKLKSGAEFTYHKQQVSKKLREAEGDMAPNNVKCPQCSNQNGKGSSEGAIEDEGNGNWSCGGCGFSWAKV